MQNRFARNRRRGAWAWPLVLALAFAAALGGWLQWSDQRDLDDERHTLIADALTLDSRLSDWLATEQRTVTALAAALPGTLDEARLLREAGVGEGLRRLWVSVTVLDANNRLLAHVPPQAPRPQAVPQGGGHDESGLSAHLAAPTPSGGQLIVRFAPGVLLRQTVPWWLARRYDVRLVDGFGQLIATSGDVAAPVRGQQSHRVSLEPAMADAYLELTTREPHVPWWRTLPLALMVAFLLLSAAASVSLRRQMREARQAEERWRTEAAFRRSIEDSLTVGVRGRDAEGRLVHVNRAFCELVGYSAEQLLGRVPPMPYWPPDSVDESMWRHQRNMAGGAPPEGYEARWIHADGHELHVMVFEAPLVNAVGRQIGWMGSIVDITARRQAEERERQRSEALATQARLTTLGEVASALAHQLNQPLAAITSYNGGVLRSLERAGFDDELVLDALRRLGEQAGEAGRIVQRIRGFLTRRAPQRERCRIDDIVQHAVALLRRDLLQRGIALELAIAPDLPPLLADPVLIEQVLINLLRNAADALAGHAAPQLRLSAQAAGPRFVRVDVDDNGPGLGGRSIDVLSAPFHSTKRDGMGMGLAICRSVVEAHHGGLEAGSGPLGGARFSFTLPLAGDDDDEP
ncbi:sensor histidine kinase [Aquabacterium sp.]|uniref:sensor histidine kinase n=1 Tax=Aquabacterium sp. TaxID=1872578 RepID=UPI0037838BC8